MSLNSISFDRNDDGSTSVVISLVVPRAGKFDANLLNNVLAVLDGGEPETANDAPEAPKAAEGRRSRRSTADAPGVSEANPTNAQPAATGRRGRRTMTESQAPDSAPATADAVSPTEPSRRRRQQPGAPAGISDADLSKAASQAAEKITPEVVTEILTEFGVGEVNKIPQDLRREFIDLLNSEVEKVA